MSDRRRRMRSGDKERRPRYPVGLPVRGGVFLLVLLALTLPAVTAMAVSVFDLIHDTPLSRKKYRMEILGFGTEMTPVKTSESSGDRAEALWLTRQRYRELGETEKADAQLEAILEWQQEEGRENLIPYAAILIREAFREMEGGRSGRAETLHRFAHRLAPGYPAAYLAGGYLALKKNRFDLPAFTKGVYGWLRVTAADAYHLMIFLGASAAVLLLAGIILAMIWTLAVFTRYFTYSLHDVEELSGRRFHFETRKTVAVVVLLLPLLTLTSPAWLAGLVIMVTWAYQAWKEKVVSVLVILFLCCLPFLARWGTASLLFMDDGLTRALMAVGSGSERPNDLKALEAHLREIPGDPVSQFSLADHAWRTGDLAVAEELYREVIKAGPLLEYEATMNMGNVFTVRGELSPAAETYRKATAIRPDSAKAHYNLAQVLNLQFSFQEGEREMKLAIALDKDLVSRRSSGTGENPMRMLVSEKLPLSVFFARIPEFGQPESVRTAGFDLWSIFLTGVPGTIFPFLMLATLVAAVVIQQRLKRRGLTKRCVKCGRPYCPACLPGAVKTSICPQCQHIFIVKEGVESSMRVEKMMEVKSFKSGRRRLAFLLSVPFPGSGQVYLGFPLAGALLAISTALMALLTLGWHGPFTDPRYLHFPWIVFLSRVWAVFLLVLYLVNLISVFYLGGRED